MWHLLDVMQPYMHQLTVKRKTSLLLSKIRTSNLVESHIYKSNTSINETRTAAIIPKAWPASKVGAPHWRGYGIFILFAVNFKVNKVNRKYWGYHTNYHSLPGRWCFSTGKFLWPIRPWTTETKKLFPNYELLPLQLGCPKYNSKRLWLSCILPFRN